MYGELKSITQYLIREMKRCSLLISLLQYTLLCGHGFSADTLVLLAENGWQQISTVAHRVQKKKIAVASYDTDAAFQTVAPATRGGRSTTNCFIHLGFEGQLKDAHRYAELACTPTQEFYCVSTQQWTSAYLLKIGDKLLCAHNTTKTVASISLIKEPLEIFTIEVKRTHTFFVTQHSILTHNMVLPLAFNLGLSIPFGASAGGSIGSFFGPATIVLGATVGCMVGALVKMVYNDRTPRYTFDAYDPNSFEQHIKQQSTAYIDTENEPSLSIIIHNPPQAKPGCGSGTEHVEQNYGTPLMPPPEPAQKPGCIYPPVEMPIILINVPVEAEHWSNYIVTQDKQSDKEKEHKRYVGPKYERTERWIENSPIGKEFERTDKGFQGKRAFKLKKDISGIIGISAGDHVVIDAAHGDHLEVYNKHGTWTHVANFDGSRNEEKTEQGKRKPRRNLNTI